MDLHVCVMDGYISTQSTRHQERCHEFYFAYSTTMIYVIMEDDFRYDFCPSVNEQNDNIINPWEQKVASTAVRSIIIYS